MAGKGLPRRLPDTVIALSPWIDFKSTPRTPGTTLASPSSTHAPLRFSRGQTERRHGRQPLNTRPLSFPELVWCVQQPPLRRLRRLEPEDRAGKLHRVGSLSSSSSAITAPPPRIRPVLRS